jgi:hypothetical protein
MTDWEAQLTPDAQDRASLPWARCKKCNIVEIKDFWTLERVAGLIKALEVIMAFSRPAHFMSLTDFIGKTLYPRRQQWERRRNVKILLAVTIITLVIIALFGLVMVLNGSGSARPALRLPSSFS